MGGTNAHVIIEQAPNLERKSISGKSEHLVLLLSAKSERSLKLMAQKLALWLEQQEDEDLPDILANLGLYRPKFGYGLSIVAETKDGLISKLKHSASSDHPSVRNKNETSKRVVFMYPGGGSQYGNMARDLYEHDSTFREELESALSVAYAATGVDFRSVLLPKRDEIERVSQLMRNKPAYAMVATVMIEYCLTKLLLSKGLEPWSMIGHSLGEYTAAVVAEVMTLGDAFKLLWARGRLSAKVPAGSMLAVSLSPDKLQPLLFGSLDISVENAPELSVVSGSKEDLKKLREVLQGFENINTREIPIEIPAHSQLLAPVLDEFFSVCKGINFQQPTRRFISSHTNEWADDKVATAEYWRDHFIKPVKFSTGVKKLSKDEDCFFLEVGPGTTLSSLIRLNSEIDNNSDTTNLLRHAKEEKTTALAF